MQQSNLQSCSLLKSQGALYIPKSSSSRVSRFSFTLFPSSSFLWIHPSIHPCPEPLDLLLIFNDCLFLPLLLSPLPLFIYLPLSLCAAHQVIFIGWHRKISRHSQPQKFFKYPFIKSCPRTAIIIIIIITIIWIWIRCPKFNRPFHSLMRGFSRQCT